MKIPKSRPIRLGGYSDALLDLSDEELARRRSDTERLLRAISDEEERRLSERRPGLDEWGRPKITWGISPSPKITWGIRL